MKLITTCLLLLLAGQESFGLRILGLFPVAGKSHLSVTSPVMHALAKKGHDVTMFLPFSAGFNASNYREIIYDTDVKLGSYFFVAIKIAVNVIAVMLLYWILMMAMTFGSLGKIFSSHKCYQEILKISIHIIFEITI